MLALDPGQGVSELGGRRAGSAGLVATNRGKAGSIAEIELRKGAIIRMIADIQSDDIKLGKCIRTLDRERHCRRKAADAEANLVDDHGRNRAIMRQQQVAILLGYMFAAQQPVGQSARDILPAPSPVYGLFLGEYLVDAHIVPIGVGRNRSQQEKVCVAVSCAVWSRIVIGEQQPRRLTDSIGWNNVPREPLR